MMKKFICSRVVGLYILGLSIFPWILLAHVVVVVTSHPMAYILPSLVGLLLVPCPSASAFPNVFNGMRCFSSRTDSTRARTI